MSTGPYTYQSIYGGGISDCHFRVRDAQDNRIATCYLEANAKLIADTMNAADIRQGTIHMTVDRLGGTVEGQPTHELNFLQRVDELRRFERAYEAVQGHGVTLPRAGMYSKEFSDGYQRGVDSQRRAAKEAFESDED